MATYYGLLTLSVVLFGVAFLFNDRYSRQDRGGFGDAVLFLLIANVAGVLILLAMNGFRLSLTPFTLLMAGITAVDFALYTVCSVRALTRIDLSLFSVFAMLGGMVLPLLVGLFFYHEPMTWGVGVCVALVTAALLLTAKPGSGRGGFWYYAGVFVFNGMSGVLTTFFTGAPYQKAGAADFTIWIALFIILFATVALPFVRRGIKRPRVSTILWSAGYGIAGRIGNYGLVLALAVLPASVQYPFVTGGTMAVCTLLSYAVGQRPSPRELCAVFLSVLGVVLLVLL